ncbi:MAG: hypothetical protein LDL33_13680 [Desulfomonile sp.]|nr:hypothetical protein [Desulfomonile sp.]
MTMKKLLILIGGLVVICFATYGAIRAVSDLFGGRAAEKASEVAQSFAAGTAAKAGEKIAEAIKQIPDKKLEDDAELMTRKLYYLSKGALKGQIDAILSDPNRAEVPQKMYEAGKDISERVVKPFARGLAESSSGLLEGGEDQVRKLKELTRESKDLLEVLTQQLGQIGKAIKENAPPLPPPPGFPSPARPFPQTPYAPPFPGVGPEQGLPMR